MNRLRRILAISQRVRFSVAVFSGLLLFLFFGEIVSPGFTDYWGYLVLQTAATLVAVIVLDSAFADEGGLAWQTHLIAIVATCADILGNAAHLYDAWGPYDKVVHFTSGAIFAAATHEILSILAIRGRFHPSWLEQAASSVLVSFLIAGVAWETYEHLSDTLFHSGRVQGRADTIGDLISDTLGALFAVSVLRVRLRHRQTMKLSDHVETA